MTKTFSHLILTGSISIDRIMNFSGRYQDLIQADKLHVLSLSVLLDKLVNTRGGVAANIAYNLALLGHAPILLSSIGADAQDYLLDLKSVGVNTAYTKISPLPTATYTVMTDSQDNQVGGFYPGAMSDVQGLTLAPWYNTDTLVVISAGDPTLMNSLVEECKSHSLPYVYDVGQQVTNISVDDLRAGLSGASILFGNDYEIGAILGRTGMSESELVEMMPVIVTTLGAEGTRITGSSIQDKLLIPALSKIKVIDPTGAGDAYRAGFLYAYLQGQSLKACAELGSTVASFAIEQHGTQIHTFTLAEVMKKHYSAYGTKI